MTGHEMEEMARQCAEMMRTMGAMTGMHGESEMGMRGIGGMGPMIDLTGGDGLPVIVVVLLLTAAAVAVAVYLIRRPVAGRLSEASPALVELDRRYARGEVDRETFLQIRRDLRAARR